jgi:hypothetical protein
MLLSYITTTSSSSTTTATTSTIRENDPCKEMCGSDNP